MGKLLTAHNAVIKTAAVTVKTLTIEGRQVTMAVFRQLQRKNLINRESGELNGIPWGTVNYFWNGCGGEAEYGVSGEHLHLVWQHGDQLLRDCIGRKRPLDGDDGRWIRGIESDISIALQCYVNATYHGRKPPSEERSPVKIHVGGWQIAVPTNAHCFRCANENAAHHADHTPGYFRFENRVGEGDITYLMERYPGMSPAAIVENLEDKRKQVITERNQANVKWGIHYEELMQLDQLFIAV